MLNHPANRAKQIKAMREANVDPKIGEWPGDPGYNKPLSSTNKDFARVARECVEAAKAADARDPHCSRDPHIREIANRMDAAVLALNCLLVEAACYGIYADVSVENRNDVPAATARARRISALLKVVTS